MTSCGQCSIEKLAGDLLLVLEFVPKESEANRRFPSCLSPLFQSESKCEAFHMEIYFIHMSMNQNFHVNKANFHMKGFALGLALKQRRNATRKSPIVQNLNFSVQDPLLIISLNNWPDCS